MVALWKTKGIKIGNPSGNGRIHAKPKD